MNKKPNSFRDKLIFLILFLMFSFSNSNAQDYKKLKADLSKIQKEFNVPGVSIAVVKGDRVVFEYNNGLIDLNKEDSISNKTLFSIASITKTFTAAGIGILLDQNKLSLEDLIVQHLPWFKLKDEYVTQNLTIRDVLSHRSGLSSEGLIYMGSGFDRKETVVRLRDMSISNQFRASFTYSNILFNALGLIIEKVSGSSWEDYIQENILDAAEMINSISDFEKPAKNKIAGPHRFIDYEFGQIQPVLGSFSKSNGPAGGIRSTSSDMAKYLMLLLRNGPVVEDTIFQPQNTRCIGKQILIEFHVLNQNIILV